MDEQENKRVSKSLLPPEAVIAGVTSLEDQPKVESVEISTPKNPAAGTLTDSFDDTYAPPLTDNLDAIDLNIINLESSSDIRLGLDGRARSSPSFRVIWMHVRDLIYLLLYLLFLGFCER